jgi:hypothetical protein
VLRPGTDEQERTRQKRKREKQKYLKRPERCDRNVSEGCNTQGEHAKDAKQRHDDFCRSRHRQNVRDVGPALQDAFIEK